MAGHPQDAMPEGRLFCFAMQRLEALSEKWEPVFGKRVRNVKPAENRWPEGIDRTGRP